MAKITNRHFWTFSLAGHLVCFAVAIGLVLFSWGPIVQAKWGLIDDHEIMAFIGPETHLPLANLVGVLEETELNSNSTLPRFRPAYYVLRAFEAVVWGKDPMLWYATRLAIALVFAGSLAFLAIRFGGPILAPGMVFMALSCAYWGDVFGRAGPAETYSVAGIALIVVTILSTWFRAMRIFPALAIAVGVVISAGSKENFVILGGIPLWFLIFRWRFLTRSARTIFLCVLVYLAWIVVTVWERVHATGMDIHADDVSISSRLAVVSSFFSQTEVIIWCVGLVVLLIADRATNPIPRDDVLPEVSSWKRQLIANTPKHWFILLSTMLVLYALLFVFYAGKWSLSDQTRYSFPGILLVQFAGLIGVQIASSIAIKVTRTLRLVLSVQVIISVVAIIVSYDGAVANRAASIRSRDSTVNFMAQYESLRDQLRSHPEFPLVITSYAVNDYESIVSLTRFLRADSVRNPIVVQMIDYTSASFPPNSLQRILAGHIENWSNGVSNFGLIPLANVRLQVAQGQCVSAGMHGPARAECKGGIQIWPY